MIGESDGDRLIRHGRQHAEIKHDHYRDEEPQDQKKFSLSDQIGLAGFIDQFGNLEHGAMHWHFPQARINDQAETQAKNTKQNADHQQPVTVNSEEQHLGEVGQLQTGFTADFMSRLGQGGGSAEAEDGNCGCHRPHNIKVGANW